MTMPKYDKGNKLDRIAGAVSRLPELVLNTPHNLFQLGRFVCSLPSRLGTMYEELENNRPEGTICVRDLVIKPDGTESTEKID